MRTKRAALPVIVICALLFTGSPIRSQRPSEAKATGTGVELLAQCELTLGVGTGSTNDQPIDRGFAIGYCIGLVSGVSATANYAGDIPLVCEPDGQITTGQEVRIVVKFLQDHPEQLHGLDSSLVFAALQTAFPCGQAP